MPDNKPTPKPAPPPVSNKIRSDWNEYLSYLEKKGYKGNPQLDKFGMGYKVFDDYVKTNPNTSLRRENLPQVRQEILNYRQWVLDESKKPIGQRKAALQEGVNDNNFMRHVLENEKTQDPNLPGSQMTSTAFPQSFLNTFQNNQLVDTKNKGFASIPK